MQTLLIRLVRPVLGRLKRFLPRPVLDFYHEFRREYPLVNRSEVVLYAGPDLFPGYSPRRPLTPEAASRRVQVSLIATVRNEAGSAREWLSSLLNQTRPPDEVVITDGGSTDGTLELLQEFARSYPIELRVLPAPGANIARGRNLAIEAARHPIVACTDFGCVLEPDWLEKLVFPFEADEQIEVSAGYYQIRPEKRLDRLTTRFLILPLERLDPSTFLPSARSLALKKAFWERAGRYPEWLADAGEDTLFDYQAKALPARWAFVPGARVYWGGPGSLLKLLKTYRRYSRGDGEVGILAPHYWWRAVVFFTNLLRRGLVLLVLLLSALLFGPWSLALLAVLLAVAAYRLVAQNRPISAGLGLGGFYPYTLADELVGAAQVLGFSEGVLRRPQTRARQVHYYHEQLAGLLARHPQRRGVVVYPPTHDWGFMFQRPHQMARALARQGYLYFYCTRNERTDAVVGFQPVEPNLYLSHVPVETFAALPQPLVYLGAAWHRGLLPLFDRPQVIYDHYDDLEVSGANPADHQALLQESRLVLVTSRLLAEAVRPVRPDALLAPNGVDYDFIQCSRPRGPEAAPADLGPVLALGKPVAGYSGALAEWFDYDLLAVAARLRPDIEFVLIGVDYDGSLGRSGVLNLPNVRWLGMKPYGDLFSYIWRFDLGLVPFKVNAITLATSPIKLFEYMACRLPVVSTGLPECRIYPEVFIAEDPTEFAAHLPAALRARQDPVYRARLEAVARANTWDSRAQEIIAALG